jgi:hypothetical protein
MSLGITASNGPSLPDLDDGLLWNSAGMIIGRGKA